MSYKSQITELIGAQEKIQQQVKELQKEKNKMRLKALEQRSTVQMVEG
jgi:hypothetical protein